MLWRSADLKEEEDIHNPTDQLWKLIDNQQLSLDQVSFGFKSHKKLDGVPKKKTLTLVAQFSKISCKISNWNAGIPVSEDMYIKHTHFVTNNMNIQSSFLTFCWHTHTK